MRQFIMIIALAVSAAGCSRKTDVEAKTEARTKAEIAADTTPGDPATFAATGANKRRLFLDVHDLGAGKVDARAAASAHGKDLATEGKYGVDYKAYWVDEKEGKIYCLAEAPSAEAAAAVHREAHGLVADRIMEVTSGNSSWVPAPDKKLFLDVHHFGPGKVTADDVAVEAAHDDTYLNYWFDPASGTVMCLSQAPSAAAAIAVHNEAHGLIPDSIEEVVEGR
jgi:hypothetical protein